MSRHLQTELDKLRKSILSMAAAVEEAVLVSVKALELRDPQLAQQVIAGDNRIDHMEVDIEEECLKVLALHQPVAGELRFVIALLKINNDLERIADLAVNIAERAAYLSTQPVIEIPFDLRGMAQKTSSMLKGSLDALVTSNSFKAQQIRSMDDEVDSLNRTAFEAVEQRIREHIEEVNQLIQLLSVARHLERIADQATNIAEDVVYMVAGEIVRHRHEDYSTVAAQRGRR